MIIYYKCCHPALFRMPNDNELEQLNELSLKLPPPIPTNFHDITDGSDQN